MYKYLLNMWIMRAITPDFIWEQKNKARITETEAMEILSQTQIPAIEEE